MAPNFNGNYHYGEAKDPCLNKKTLVASYPANAWGLYDTVGNVREWCLDGYNDKLPGGADPFVSPEGASVRVIRGGSWSDAGRFCRSACRFRASLEIRFNDLGFRLAAVPSGAEPSPSKRT